MKHNNSKLLNFCIINFNECFIWIDLVVMGIWELFFWFLATFSGSVAR